MRAHYYKYITPVILALVFTACSQGNGGTEEPELDFQPISLSSEVETAGVQSVAVTKVEADGEFPNGGSIGIIAARYPDTTPDEDWTPDWENSYPDIDNASATKSGYNTSTGYYSFQWDRQRYWPFDGGKLVFMAYSPYTDNSGDYLLSANREYLLINLNDPMVDVLYASNNNADPLNVYSKSPNTAVDLGTFRHVMSQLTVVVEAGPDMESTIVLSALSISTLKTEAEFHLPSGDEGLFVNENPSIDRFTYTLVNSNTAFSTEAFSDTVMLFPGTEEDTSITFELVDTGTEGNRLQKTVMMTFFAPSNIGDEPVTLQRGKNTVLTIRVNSITATQKDFELQGQLIGWTTGPSFHIDIK